MTKSKHPEKLIYTETDRVLATPAFCNCQKTSQRFTTRLRSLSASVCIHIYTEILDMFKVQFLFLLGREARVQKSSF